MFFASNLSQLSRTSTHLRDFFVFSRSFTSGWLIFILLRPFGSFKSLSVIHSKIPKQEWVQKSFKGFPWSLHTARYMWWTSPFWIVDCGPPPDHSSSLNKTHSNWSQRLPQTLAPTGCSLQCLPFSVQCLGYLHLSGLEVPTLLPSKLQSGCNSDWQASTSMNITVSLMK